MSNLCAYFSSSVGKKQLVAVTGLGLSTFVLLHMSGNLLLFLGADAYNLYSHKLTSTPLIYVAEAGLIGFFLVHMGLAIKLTLENRKARGVAPSQLPSASEKRASFASRSMALTGLLIFAFLILHLKTFKYGTHYSTTVDGVEMRDLYQLVRESFLDPVYTGYYLFSLVVLFVHLSHGVAASFQSLGLSSIKNCKLRKAGILFALIVAAGFIAQPLYFLLGGGK